VLAERVLVIGLMMLLLLLDTELAAIEDLAPQVHRAMSVDGMLFYCLL
jgi:hypothetical protein